eukprot:m.84592 g.84592  ORF g.84592 m.84592 type:complete len:389 (-) comp8714_c0_seq41:185-1351(-)
MMWSGKTVSGSLKKSKGNVEAFVALLEKSAPANTSSTSLFTPSTSNAVSPARVLVQAHDGNGVCDTNWFYLNKSRDTVLHASARHGYSEILSFLISPFPLKGMSLDVKNNVGHTPLHEAILSEDMASVQLLVERGANVNVTKHADWSPLHLACTKSNLEIVKFLVERGSRIAPLNKDGWTPLHVACRTGCEDIVSYLLEMSPQSISTCSNTKRTPLMTAAMNGHVDVVKVLLAASSNPTRLVHECDSSFWSPLFWAATGGHLRCIRLLINYGCDITHKTKEGRGIVHICAASGDGSEYFSTSQEEAIAVLEFVLDNCPPEAMNEQDKMCLTPLHLAAMNGHLEHVKVLVEKGSDVNARDKFDRKPIDLAASHKKEHVVRYLLRMTSES